MVDAFMFVEAYRGQKLQVKPTTSHVSSSRRRKRVGVHFRFLLNSSNSFVCGSSNVHQVNSASCSLLNLVNLRTGPTCFVAICIQLFAGHNCVRLTCTR